MVILAVNSKSQEKRRGKKKKDCEAGREGGCVGAVWINVRSQKKMRWWWEMKNLTSLITAAESGTCNGRGEIERRVEGCKMEMGWIEDRRTLHEVYDSKRRTMRGKVVWGIIKEGVGG